MKTLLIGNGNVITRNPELPFIADGCVAVEGAHIKEVGPAAQLKARYAGAEWIDAKGGVIMPGLINAHNHIYSAMARGLSIAGHNPSGFMDILEGMWWRLDRLLTMEQVRYSALATYIDCIKSGVTTVFDHHASYGAIEGSLFTIADAARELGVRTCLCYEVSDRDGEEKMKAAVKENEDFIIAAEKNGADMQKGMMGLHASFTLSDKTLDYCAAHKPDYTGYHVHVAEGADDVEDSVHRYGKRVVERLNDMGILGDKTIAAHCIHVGEGEMDILKDTGTMVVHNPESNMGNAVGCGPVPRLFDKKVRLGLGTDGYTNDMLESYKVGNIIHKHNTGDPGAAWAEIPAMLFGGNAEIAGQYFKKTLGVLKEGAGADIIVADYDPLTPMNAGNCNSHILFGMNGRSVASTIVAGRVLMKDRTLPEIDEARVMAKSREQAAELWKSING